MSDQEIRRRPEPRPQRPSQPVLAFTLLMLPIRWSFALLFMVLGSLMLSIIIEWVGMSFQRLWKDEGVNHSYSMLQQEVGYLNDDFRQKIFGIDPYKFAESVARKTHHIAFVQSGFTHLIHWLKAPSSSQSAWKNGLRALYSRTSEYVRAAMIMTELIAVRVSIAILSLPAFALIALAAVIDGLVERDLRKFGGGMERAMLYHYVKPHAKPIIVIAWMLYLSSPFSLHPNVIFVPAALMFGLVLFTTVSSFKKFM